MVKPLALPHCLTRALLPALFLVAPWAQAAPSAAERAGLPDDARPVWVGDQRYYLARDTWFLASGSDARYTPVPAPREIQMAGVDMFDVIAYPINNQTDQ